MDQKVVILGAGPSGLGVAWGLVDHGFRNILVVEKRPTVGGLSGTVTQEGLSFDLGPHRFSPEYPDLVERLKELMGDEFVSLPNEHAVVFRDRLYFYPPRVGDFANRESVRFGAEVLSSYFAARFSRTIKEDSFRTRIEKSFGPRLYEEVVGPMCEKVWGNPLELDPEFAGVRFSVPTFVQWSKRYVGEKKASRDKTFWYPRAGFQALWNRLEDQLRGEGVEFLKSATCTELVRQNNRIESAQIRTEVGKFKLPVSWLVSTIPSSTLQGLLGEAMDHPEPPPRSMVLVVFLVKGKKHLPARVVLLPEKKYLFNRLSDQGQFSQEMVPEGKSVILADVLVEREGEFWKRSDAAISKIVLDQVLPLGFFQASDVEKVQVLRVPDAYPVPSQAKEAWQRETNQRFSRYENLFSTGRLASSDYNNSHSALKKGQELARFISEKRAPSQWYPYAEQLRQVPIRD